MSARLSPHLLERFIIGSYKSKPTDSLLAQIEEQLEAREMIDARVLRALVACKMGAEPESVAKILDWKEFEHFCSRLLTARGFEVWENLRLTRPRAQIDILAVSSSAILTIDCKHSVRIFPPSFMEKIAEAQLERSRLVRKSRGEDPRPIYSAIVTLTEQKERFSCGAAIVPLHTLPDFLRSLEEYDELKAV